MYRFFVSKEAFEDEVVKITGSDFNHISHSLRLKVGDRLVVNNGDGLDYIVEIDGFDENTVFAVIKGFQENRSEPSINISLAQALPKKGNMELIIQKCTEIGISKIIPISTERTIVKLEEKKQEKKIIRWQKIAEEAAKQSRRGKIPSIEGVCRLRELYGSFPAYDLVLIPWEEEEKKGFRSVWQGIKKRPQDILIIIGPEGGFSAAEIESVKQHGGIPITLGPRIFRTETAGFVALITVLYQAGELGG